MEEGEVGKDRVTLRAKLELPVQVICLFIIFNDDCSIIGSNSILQPKWVACYYLNSIAN